MNSIKISLLATGAAFATISQATPNINAFADGTNFSGVTVSQSGKAYTVSVANGATVKIGSTTYNIIRAFGFFTLRDVNPDNQGASGSDFSSSTGNWKFGTNNAGVGSVAGWESQGSAGVTGGHSQTFTFNTINVANVNEVGFHLGLSQHHEDDQHGDTFRSSQDDENTQFVKFSGRQAVPEPFSMAALATGAIAVIRRRKIA